MADFGNEEAAFFSLGPWEAALLALHASWDDSEGGTFVERAYESLCADVRALQWLHRCDHLERLSALPAPAVMWVRLPGCGQIDIESHKVHGDLRSSFLTWRRLAEPYGRGKIAATLAGGG